MVARLGVASLGRDDGATQLDHALALRVARLIEGRLIEGRRGAGVRVGVRAAARVMTGSGLGLWVLG